jgi:glycosyltransferase involved in cell wall biosynthesis
MGGAVPKSRINYWTGFLDPETEAISKEVFALHERQAQSFIYGLSKYYFLKYSAKLRYLGLNIGLYPLLKILGPVIEKQAGINHIFSEANEWFFLKILKHGPIVFTMVGGECTLPIEHYSAVTRIVVESEVHLDHLVSLGFNRKMIRLIYPGVDPKKFTYAPPSAERFRILFASVPPEAKELEAKGIYLLIELAQKMPEIDVVILARPWQSLQAVRQMVAAARLPNVILVTDPVKDMNRVFADIHATVMPTVFDEVGKSAPLSLLESLMAGKPVLLSRHVEIGGVLEREGCAVVFDTDDPDGLPGAVRTMIADSGALQSNSRRCAEKYFTLDRFVRQYEDLYNEISG